MNKQKPHPEDTQSATLRPRRLGIDTHQES
ncbi:MAG: hypothetical protein Dbin4_03156, partial [Alphaproteobacteria bacterium]|nr:hypothetical protein [Alphaproteobacteria bacterium]